MDDGRDGRKRGKPDTSFNGEGEGSEKRNKQGETESSFTTTGIGSKLKPCTKFFSTTGCHFGDGCRFLHYVPGGIIAVAEMTNLGSDQAGPSSKNSTALKSSTPCNYFNSAEGCRYGGKCLFSHGERELQRSYAHIHGEKMVVGPPHRTALGGWFPGRIERPPPPQAPGVAAAAANFGASATTKCSVDAALAGAIIGKGGINTTQIFRLTGAKLAVKEHESDPNLKNIELEGSLDQIEQANTMVCRIIKKVDSAVGTNYKTKLCEHHTKGSCDFKERCNFAHGVQELRK